jgi:hypothetical protein
VTYFVVQAWQAGSKGVLVPDAPREARTADQALSLALRLSEGRAGVVAFSRTGDTSTGDFDDAVIIAQHGMVPGDLMEMAS